MMHPSADEPGQLERPRILLVAPNISRRMGGEAIKALMILEGLLAMGCDVVQITHARVRDEMRATNANLNVHYVEDGPVQKLLYRLRLDWALLWLGAWLLHRKARQVARDFQPWIVHFTSPISPNIPYFRFPGVSVVIGPLNGNILHPPTFADRETWAKRVGQKILAPVQKISGLFFRGKRSACLLISGGERTVDALMLGGCRREQMVFTLDSGVDPQLVTCPAMTHDGPNFRFVFLGRLVRYKGCDLAIRALKSVPQAQLDIIGDGEERRALEDLARNDGVQDRVRFLGWVPGGAQLFDRLRSYRAFVFPSLAEANGIVVQEAMMLGLPVIAVNWGGPAELLDDDTGVLIEPVDEARVISELAVAMARLGADGEAANQLAVAARDKAERAGFSWPDLLHHWLTIYDAATLPSASRSFAQALELLRRAQLNPEK
ncbi:glycosyltransferase family 4 protein [Sphingobium subterraneum]|uniref:Glycosyltransferase involved in cell wall biosynthesis n=1 Tax=Sphingobium subterraneum TaxID=627688 RepID=A0A841J1E2_9SPHN|nr:glycosyltransferase family 4 protein [Sphingobium subterraneum]MBB6122485.1 glycosyltransferase involved in cell wall biosynthesis [Sphingobium subterraneum]